jgi:hypothetical protein
MNLYQELSERLCNERILKQSFESKECNEYEFFDNNNRKTAYLIEYYNNPLDNTKLKKPVYELYYDNSNKSNDYTEDDFLASNVYDSFIEMWVDLFCYIKADII